VTDVETFIDSAMWHGGLERANAMLTADPSLAARSIFTAAILGDDARQLRSHGGNGKGQREKRAAQPVKHPHSSPLRQTAPRQADPATGTGQRPAVLPNGWLPLQRSRFPPAGKSHIRARKSIAIGSRYKPEDIAIRRKYAEYSSLPSCWPALNGISPLCNISLPQPVLFA